MPAALALRVGLLRRLAGQRLGDVACALGVSPSSVARISQAHARALAVDAWYHAVALELARALLGGSSTCESEPPFAEDALASAGGRRRR